MVNVSRKFMQQLYNDQRNYLVRVEINLADTNHTVLTLTNENIWDFSPTVEDAVSSDEDLQIGTAIINKFSFTINNIYETYSQYDFKDAKVFLTVGLDIGDDTVERIKKGTFYVDTADYNDTFITLECLDGMHKFEKPFKASTITFPATAGYVVNSICTACGVILDTTSFPNKDYIIASAPDKDTCTYREVLSWIAQICGCFARFNQNGNLDLKWYDRTSLETVISGLDGGIFDVGNNSKYQTGDTADGGSFNPWNTGYVYDNGDFADMINSVHYINTAYNQTMSVDDVVITGVRILVKTKDVVDSETGAVTNTDVISTHFQGTEGYIIEISENPFITEDNVNVIISYLGTQLIGLRFRKANLSIPSDPSIEAGDVAIYWDRKGNYHPILVSRTTFITGEAQTIVSSAQTPARNSAERYSAETKNYVAIRKQLREEKSARELMFDSFQEQMEHASGMYCTEVEDEETHAVTTYYHNKPLLADSDIRIVISNVGIAVTNNGTDTTPTWYGLEVNGNMIANILSVIGINADWINAGALTVKDANNNETFYVDTETGTVRIKASSLTVAANAISVGGKTVNTIASEAAAGAVTDARSYVDAKMSGIETNLLKDSLGLTDTYWRYNGTLTRNQSDPFGGTNAVLLTPPSGGEGYLQAKPSNNNPFGRTGVRYKFSVWLKATSNTSNPMKLYLNGMGSDDFVPTTTWAKYETSGLVNTPFSANDLITIGGFSSFTSSDNYNLYIYNPVCEYTFTAEEIYKAVSDDGTTRGWWMVDNHLYINMDYLQGGVAKFGSSLHGKGVVQIYDDNDQLIGTIDSTGIKYAGSGSSGNNLSSTYTKLDNQGLMGFYSGKMNGRLDLSNGTLVSLRYYSTSATGILICAQENTQQSSIAKFEKTFITFYTNYTGYNSDRRLKTNFAKADFDIIDKLKTLSYDWKDTGNHVSVGLVAQDVREVFPELVLEDEKGILSINYIGIIPHLVHKVQQQQKQINDLESRLARLEAIINGKEGETKR